MTCSDAGEYNSVVYGVQLPASAGAGGACYAQNNGGTWPVTLVARQLRLGICRPQYMYTHAPVFTWMSIQRLLHSHVNNVFMSETMQQMPRQPRLTALNCKRASLPYENSWWWLLSNTVEYDPWCFVNNVMLLNELKLIDFTYSGIQLLISSFYIECQHNETCSIPHPLPQMWQSADFNYSKTLLFFR